MKKPPMTPPPRPARRGLRLNQFVAAATVATVAVSAVGLAAQLRPVQAAPARAGATALIVKLADAGRDDAAQRAQLQHVLAEAGLPLQADRPLGSGWWRLQASAAADAAGRAACWRGCAAMRGWPMQ